MRIGFLIVFCLFLGSYSSANALDLSSIVNQIANIYGIRTNHPNVKKLANDEYQNISKARVIKHYRLSGGIPLPNNVSTEAPQDQYYERDLALAKSLYIEDQQREQEGK